MLGNLKSPKRGGGGGGGDAFFGGVDGAGAELDAGPPKASGREKPPNGEGGGEAFFGGVDGAGAELDAGPPKASGREKPPNGEGGGDAFLAGGGGAVGGAAFGRLNEKGDAFLAGGGGGGGGGGGEPNLKLKAGLDASGCLAALAAFFVVFFAADFVPNSPRRVLLVGAAILGCRKSNGDFFFGGSGSGSGAGLRPNWATTGRPRTPLE